MRKLMRVIYAAGALALVVSLMRPQRAGRAKVRPLTVDEILEPWRRRGR